MTVEEIKEKVKQAVIDKLGVEEAKVTDDASFADHLGADSLDSVELIMKFEEIFDMKISDDDALKIKTVGDAVNYLQEKLG